MSKSIDAKIAKTWKFIDEKDSQTARGHFAAACNLCNMMEENSYNKELIRIEGALLALEIREFGTEEEKKMFFDALQEAALSGLGNEK